MNKMYIEVINIIITSILIPLLGISPILPIGLFIGWWMEELINIIGSNDKLNIMLCIVIILGAYILNNSIVYTIAIGYILSVLLELILN